MKARKHQKPVAVGAKDTNLKIFCMWFSGRIFEKVLVQPNGGMDGASIRDAFHMYESYGIGVNIF